ncbi:FAD-dependent monooxygenase [Nocardioides massiliensis]|uniref:2,4-dichlorophenol 6-monooxygenase n=1 Tax=Nocardioides massiliensis TaxID=1325935 RepID=A0ABT9NN23_9ACTN|nr:FAD-dependent monooxygenase [Nocardioides massiliensis]MDP9821814.1 2,4-dichlorophenol 6-monooxygenase [Nocardioides massiliensis]
MSTSESGSDGSAAYDTDVLVVGTGPAGATTALALATYGIRTRVINQRSWLANSPRAHITNQRALEVLRDLGVEDAVRRVGTPWELMGDMVFATSLTGDEVARLRTWGTGDDRRSDYLTASPCPLLDLPQPLMEPILVDGAAVRGAQVSFNVEYLDHHQDEHGVTSTVRDRLNGQQSTVRSRFLVGADGARSRIAEQIGLPFEGRMGRAGTVYARFHADLTALVAHRPSILHRILAPAFGEIGMRTLRVVRPWTTWIAGWGYDLDDAPDLDHAPAERKIREMIGNHDVAVQVENVSAWQVNQAWATEYSRGRVHCAGDAVHRHPPSSGLGSNTSIQDAFNLAWKLAYVVRGWADETLLDSYSEERAPVGRQVVARANQSRLDYQELNDLLDPDAAKLGQPSIVHLREAGPEGVAARDALAAAIARKNFEFNALGVELGQHYRSGAVVPEGDAGDEPDAEDAVLHHRATTRPGAKLPHVWLVDAQGRRISTLDIVGKGRFTLLTGLAGTAWVTAVDRLSLAFLDAVVIGADGTRDLYHDWARRRDMPEGGALLVRPDGYIAWRCAETVGDEHAQELLGATVATILSSSILSSSTQPHSTWPPAARQG